MRLALLGAALGALVTAGLTAQQPVTRAQAVAAALARGGRAAIGRADTAAAAGLARSARAFPNPTVSASYSKSTPQHHVIADLPLDLPWVRGPRAGAAQSARDAARYGFAFERAAIRLDVDTTYTLALAAAQRARLSRRTAMDADSLLAMARVRREAGDASELDVRLAAVNAGALANSAIDDSLAALDVLLDLQLAMGLAGDVPSIILADTLAPPGDTAAVAATEPLPVAAAAASLRSAQHALGFARGSLFAPSLQIGFENRDPTGSEPGILPTIGLSLPIPLFNWNGGEIAQAAAARDRARAELDVTQRETAAAVARGRRVLAAALSRLERDRDLVASADRVAAMSLQAYAEGAVALPNVLEAQRNAREALARYIDDLAAANDAAALMRLFAATGDEP
jgi:outer membrane protein, heavy metal efflux system